MNAFACPTSGLLLNEAVKAFGLHTREVGGEASEYLNTHSNASRNTRRYFSGENIPEESRQDVCRWVARAALHSSLLKSLQIPGYDRQKVEILLADALSRFLARWDAEYLRAASGWPRPDGELGKLVVGRQLAIELSLRAAALMVLCGFKNLESLELHGTGRAVIHALQASFGKDMTRSALAVALRIQKSTVDDWIDHDAVPNESNLVRLAEHLGRDEAQRERLAGWLRLQFGLVGLVRSIGREPPSPELFAGFAKLLDFWLTFIVRWPHRFAYTQAKVDVLERGIRSKLGMAACRAALDRCDDIGSPVREWKTDLVYASRDQTHARIEACFSIIGDWPETSRQLDADQNARLLSAEQRKEQWMGMSLLRMDEDALQQVLSDVRKEAVANPGCEEAAAAKQQCLSFWAWFLTTHERYEEASLVWREVLSTGGDEAMECRAAQAMIRSREDGDLNLGRRYLRRAMAHRPQWGVPVAELARSYLYRGDAQEALAVFAEAPGEVVESSQECIYTKALALKSLGRYLEALTAAEHATRLDGSHADAWSLAADLAFLVGDKEKGRRYRKEGVHLGHATVRRSGLAMPGAVCPKRTADPST